MSDSSNAPRKSGATYFLLVAGLAIAAGLGVLLQRQLAKPAPAEVAAATPAPGAARGRSTRRCTGRGCSAHGAGGASAVRAQGS